MTAFARIVETSARVARTPSRGAKIEALAGCLRALAADEVEIAVAFLSGEPRQGKLGLSYSLLSEARAAASERDMPLALREVDRALAEIATTSGRGSAQRRRQLLHTLFGQATEPERDFLLRLIVGELRQGALEGVMLDAIATAAQVPATLVRRAHMYAGALPLVAAAALRGGGTALAAFRLAPLQPVAPMLAQSAEQVGDAIERLGEAAVEWKLDGARAQVHKVDDEVCVYSRQLNDVTVAVPELVEAVRALPARELVLDGEAIALAPTGRPLPFQLTMRRFGRKLEVDRARAELPLTAFYFDCLRVDGDDLVDRSARERFAALADVLPDTMRIPRLFSPSAAQAEQFLADALARGHEGVMAKALAAPYEAGRRGAGWLKIKRARTLDLVVIAAEWGHGRRTGWLSNLHLAARDPASGFVMLGKTFKGLTDQLLEWQTEQLLAREVGRDAATVYVRPELVVEIAFNDLQASPHYPGGLALRFARVKRYRDDKRAQDADTIDTVRALYAAQG